MESPDVINRVSALSGPTGSPLRLLAKIRANLALEWSNLHPRLMMANFLLAFIPSDVGVRLRAIVYRRVVGFRIGKGTAFTGTIRVTAMGKPYGRLAIGRNCLIRPCHFTLNETVTVGDNVCISRDVFISTDSHKFGPPERRIGSIVSKPVRIEDGVWITQRCIVHPGVTVGRGSVVANSSVVTRDVPPNTLVGGVPAKVIRQLPEEGEETGELTSPEEVVLR